MKYNYIIVASSYDPIIGGSIVLHKLCDLLNNMGQNAMIFPHNLCNLSITGKGLMELLKMAICHPCTTFKELNRIRLERRHSKLNPEFNTRFISFREAKNIPNENNNIIIYPEIVTGNPLSAHHVVRFLLHNPGFHTGNLEFGENELLVRYSNSFARDYIPNKGSVMTQNFLTIKTYPSCYNMPHTVGKRQELAYIVRKGKRKNMVHPNNGAILIDGKTHEETAEIFKSAEYLVSYDPVTAYTDFALLCGCKVIIVLNRNETPETYHPDSRQRECFLYVHDDCPINFSQYNVNISKAISYIKEKKKQCEKDNNNNVLAFIKDTENFFTKRQTQS